MTGAALGFAPDWLLVAVAGLVGGAVTMLLYKRLSPQNRLTELKTETLAARKEMQAYDGTELAVVLGLMRRSVSLAFQQVRLIFVPTMIAALPIIGLGVLFDYAYGEAAIVDVGPDWFRPWPAVFLIALSVSAIVTKVAFKIE